jgi:Golgi nucleoside diphosphatase
MIFSSKQIDAGSTGSRMHLYEWKPRTLHNDHEVQEVVSGRTLSNPGTDSRWTARLRPGISTFADLPDDQIVEALAEYLEPLLDFSKHVLASKRDRFDTFPIYLRATAGMRTLTTADRARVMNGVRTLFSNTTYSPFYFQEEQARVISGEEEAIFGWAGVNFLLGTLIDDSQGAGVVVKPRLTYGALDLGGASTQISFYQPDQDIMSNLFKLQIGQGKHWNLYSHSFLEYGIEAATNRFEARLIDGMDTTERLVDGVHNPCLPGGASKHIRNNIHVDADNVETWDYDKSSVSGSYQNAILKNANTGGDYETCSTFVKALLHQDKNDWCEFSHRGDCSFAGVYQPELPLQSKHFGEFLAFSNFYHVWDFLQLPSRSTLAALDNATRTVCSMSETEVHDYAGDLFYAPAMINDMCFRSTYAFQLLRNGYGFKMDDSITATNVIGGQKVGWTLGAIMYEINTLPWHYVTRAEPEVVMDPFLGTSIFFAALVCGMLFALGSIFRSRRASQRYQYESIKQ